MDKKNILFAKLIIVLVLTIFLSYAFIQDSKLKYQKGVELTKELYVEEYTKYRNDLLDYEKYVNPISSAFFTLLAVSFLVSSYELSVWLIIFLVKKIIGNDVTTKD
jgi:hypothetical protein